MSEPILIPIEEAAELLGLSVKYLRRLNRDGELKLKRINKIQHLLWEDVKGLARNYTPPWSLLTNPVLERDSPPKISASPREPEFFDNRVEAGNCIDWMRQMPDNFVQSVITSPPYWGVRRYPGEQDISWLDGEVSQFGVEPYPDKYIQHSTEILRHLKRVLREDGVIWWNLGDTYLTRAYIRESSTERLDALEGRRDDTWAKYPYKRYSSGHPYLKDKDLSLVPFQVALAAQHLGFYLRSIIIWSKENTMPEPVKDRPTTSHEYILLLAKSRFYYYDNKAATEPAITEVINRNGDNNLEDRNLRTVWRFAVSSSHGNHTAAFPEELPNRCIKATTKPGDLVFDPFVGSGTTAIVAKKLGRKYFGCDTSEEYIDLARKRLLEINQNHKNKKNKK